MDFYQMIQQLKVTSLEFPGHHEIEFQKYYARKFLQSTRAAVIVGTFLYSLFGILDTWMLPESYPYAWTIRFAIVVPFLIFFFFFTYTKLYLRFAQAWLCSVAFLAGVGISVMVYFTTPDEPGYHYYFIGILLVSMFVHTLLRVQVRYALISTVMVIVSYVLVAVWKHEIHIHEIHILVSNLFFILGMEVLSVVAGVTIEYYQRKDFVQRKIIEERQEAFDHEIRIASRIQQSILPGENVYRDGNMTIGARYLPMVNIGGDFYDYKKTEKNILGLIIADVSGHGVPAALVASMVKVSFHSAGAQWKRPDLVLQKINEDLYAKIGLSFITAAYLCFNMEERKCAIAQAGHPPLLVQNRKSGRVKKYKPRGFPLGVYRKNLIERKIFDFNEEDRFLLCTDGLYDALEQIYPNDEVKLTDILKSVTEIESTDQALQEINSLLGLPRKDSKDDITMIMADIHLLPNTEKKAS